MKNFISEYQVGRGIWLFFKFTFGVLFLYVAWLGYQYWYAAQHPQNVPTTHNLAGMHLQGVVYFTGMHTAGTSTKKFVSAYSYDLNSGRFAPVAHNYPATSFDHGTKNYDIMTAYVASSSDPDKVQPVWFQPSAGLIGVLPGVNGYHETGIVASPDQIHYAFSYEPVDKLDPNVLNHWNVAIVNYQTGETRTITAAAKPQWINQGNDLIYMKADGLYQYNLQTQQLSLVEPSTGTLTNLDDFTVSADSKWLVFTAPDRNFISVFTASTTASTGWAQVGGVVDQHARYRFPVIAPHDGYYMVSTARDEDYDTSTNQYSKVSFQVFSLTSTSSAPLVTIPIADFVPESVTLEHWYSK